MESPRSASSTSRKKSRCDEGCSTTAKEPQQAAAVGQEGGTSALGGGTINANSFPETPDGDGTLRMLLRDPDVLKCFVCRNPLGIPSFECDGGHLACVTCCVRLQKICSACGSSIGDKRCKAMERILESSRIPCENEKHGCKEWFNVLGKVKHESACIYTPFSCPILGCDFKGPTKEVSQHLGMSHKICATSFRYNQAKRILLDFDRTYLILQEETTCDMFVLYMPTVEHGGKAFTLSRIGPSSFESSCYHLEINGRNCSVRSQCNTKSMTKVGDGPPDSLVGVLTPSDFPWFTRAFIWLKIGFPGVKNT